MSVDDPFVVLAIAPTLDGAVIKRAYFAALAKTPPHVDPEGFRKLRKAYDCLTVPGSRALAFLRAPRDHEAELARWDERFGAGVKQALADSRRAQLAEHGTEQFIERVTRMRLDELVSEKRAVGVGA